MEFCSDMDLDVRICSSDDDRLDPIGYVTDDFYMLPPSRDPQFAVKLLDLVDKEGIVGLLVWNDHDMIPMSLIADEMERRGVSYIGPKRKVIELCNDKRETAKLAKTCGVCYPKTATNVDDIESNEFPLVIKPFNGAGSVDVFKANTRDEALFFCSIVESAMCQQYVDGEEFTVDIFSDYSGAPFSCVVRKRIKVRSSESVIGEVVCDEKIKALALRVARSIAQPGPVNVQVIRRRSDGKLFLLEVNARISGGVDLSIACGAPFHKWIVQMCLKEQLDKNHSVEIGTLMGRYLEPIFYRHRDV